MLEQDKISKVVNLVCIDTTTIPSVTMEQRVKVFLDNLNFPDPIQNLRQLYNNVSSTSLPKSWGDVDLRLHYRIDTRDDAQHFSLLGEAAFNQFWTCFNKIGKQLPVS